MHSFGVDLKLMVIFRALLQHRNVTEAAKEVGRSQPAVSHALGRLRQYYRDPLFRRSGSRMEPTKRALELAVPFSQALDLIASTRQYKFEPRELTRTFRIGLVDYGGIFLVPALVKRLVDEAPNVQLICDHMDEDTAHRLLQRAELDAVVGMILEDRPGWQRTNLFRDRFSVIVRKGHPTIKRAPTIQQLGEQRHIRIPVLDKIAKMSGGAEWTQRFAMVSQNILQVPFIVEQSDLVAVLPRSFALLFSKHCKINVLNTPVHLPLYTIDLIHPETNELDPARAWLVRAIIAAGQKVRQEDQEFRRNNSSRPKPTNRKAVDSR
jgi:DNA-binding transcriptional LysR family regulator